MKIKNLILILLLFFVSNAYCQCGYPPNKYFKPRQYGFNMNCQSNGCPPNAHFKPRQYVLYIPLARRCTLSCNCTDPYCIGDNCCMSCEKCCAAFGNVGAGDFEPLGHPWMPARPCGERYIPRSERFSGGMGIAKVNEQVRHPLLHRRLVSVTRVYPARHPIAKAFPYSHHYVLKGVSSKHPVLARPKSCIVHAHPVKPIRRPVIVR